MRFEVEEIPYPLVYAEKAAFKDTYGGVEGVVVLEAYLLRPKGVPSDTVVVFTHPIGAGAYLPMVRHLARCGHHVIYCNSRYRSDPALIMEKVVLDLGACVKDAKERLGYARVVHGGWSGGGSLSLYCQEQAEKPFVKATPAGDPPDLTAAGLVRADAVMLLAAHSHRHGVLTASIDPSILDESDPEKRDPELDLYGPNAPKPPFDRGWLARYREAQVARNRRITAWVRSELNRLRAQGRVNEERGFVVHGTMANPASIDATIDPNDRPAGVSYLGDPQVVNNGPVGLARFCTLRSWLSQWSYDDALGDGVRAAANITVPVLVVENGADAVCLPEHGKALFAAVKHDDKEFHTIRGANHYYIGPDQRPHLQSAVDICTAWLAKHGLAPSAISGRA
jgi:pimeloyl-ACP methyl ester carboxylesterase